MKTVKITTPATSATPLRLVRSSGVILPIISRLVATTPSWRISLIFAFFSASVLPSPPS